MMTTSRSVSHDLRALAARAMERGLGKDADLRLLLELCRLAPTEASAEAGRIRRCFFGRSVSFCAIVNAKSGLCPQDCAFCSQSAHHNTDAPVYGLVDESAVRAAACSAKEQGASRFSLVMSGAGPDGEEFEELLRHIGVVRSYGLAADVSIGMPDEEQLERLQAGGVGFIHNNLETAESFFPSICSTHTYRDKREFALTAKRIGLEVCCGGLFGLGESWEQRLELALDLRNLGVTSIPVNFLQPIPGSPLENRPLLQPSEARGIIALLRFALPKAQIRVCGGRPAVFGDSSLKPVVQAGASGIMIGDYLTSKGADAASDLAQSAEMGLIVE